METLRKICSVVTAFSFTVYFAGANVAPMMVKAEEKTKDYIICAQSEQQVENIEKEFESSGEINENGEELLQENRMTSVQMTESEAKKMEEEMGVHFVEEDIVVEASTHVQKKFHEKKVKKIKENKSEHEWNIRMIRSDKAKKLDNNKKKKDNKEKVKIAILDSGVDWGNDIDVAQTITLVPGEEEMSPLFMDGTGHGDSVAGLIAAKDDGEGITGINPNAEIYSIRVLDDNNSAPVSRVVEAIYKAIEWDVNIINMSFGVSEYSAALGKAIRDADNAGILVIAAAGNTGEAGVQYPAVFDEVMAVGSVDKYGEVVESSAKGEEVEIVAPGELVRSTGFFGSELVESGTSLAAPQVAAVASLIWEKDLSVSADFVRTLLNESANAYGEADAYGNGLVDAEYALENYETFKKQYQEKAENAQLEKNKEEVLSFEETNCVEGCWSVEDHGDMIPLDYKNVKKGARFPDTKKSRYVLSYDSDGKADNCIFARMTINPWWHGFYQSNYIAAYIYETRLANKQKDGGTASIPSGLSSVIAAEIRDDIAAIKWKKEYDGEMPSDGTKRAFIWGMAIHNLTDTFAHSTFIYRNNRWYRLVHETGKGKYKWAHSDEPEKCGIRWSHARTAMYAALLQYNKSSHPSGTYKEFNVALQAQSSDTENSRYTLGNIYDFVNAVAGYDAAKPFAGVNCITKYATK